MGFINLVLFLSFLFLQLTVVFTQISWDHCNSDTNDIKLLNLAVNPDPIVAPGLVYITITIHTNQNLTNPLKATLSLKKKIIFGYISVPCSAIKSCTYDDLCALCTQCNCPIQEGEHTLNLPITIDSTSWMLGGTYQAQIELQTPSGQNGCVKIYNIHIQTNK